MKEREESGRQIKKRVQLRDHVISLERKLAALTEIEARFKQERKLKHTAEESLCAQLTENSKLRKIIEELQKKNAKLEAKYAQSRLLKNES